MSVGRICIREVDTAGIDESAFIAAGRMHQRAVGALVIVNDVAEPIGIITDRDLLSRVLLTVRIPTETSLGEIMTPAPKTVSEETPVESALAIMRSGRFRRLPVVDHDNKLVGLVTLDDILMLLAEEFVQIGKLLEGETPRGIIEEKECSTTSIRRLQNPAIHA